MKVCISYAVSTSAASLPQVYTFVYFLKTKQWQMAFWGTEFQLVKMRVCFFVISLKMLVTN